MTSKPINEIFPLIQLRVQLGRVDPNPTHDQPEFWVGWVECCWVEFDHGLGFPNSKKVPVDSGLTCRATQPNANSFYFSKVYTQRIIHIVREYTQPEPNQISCPFSLLLPFFHLITSEIERNPKNLLFSSLSPLLSLFSSSSLLSPSFSLDVLL